VKRAPDVRITSPDRVLFPQLGLTKEDLIAYYLEVAPHVLNHVRNRPMQMLRWPHGVEGEGFYQKRVPPHHPPFVETVHIVFPSGNEIDFAVVNNVDALAWVVNLGCIDLHTWHSRVRDYTKPDYLLIDLDPSEGNPWSSVQRIALVVKEVMEELELASYPKTSGSTGLHILAPIRPELDFHWVRDFAKALAKEVERRIDDQRIATTTWKVADREGVFVDYGQNARDRTIACAYSVRPNAEARASAPLRWEEVADVEPSQFTLLNMRDRIEEVGDPTAGMWRRKVSLLPRFERLGLEPPEDGSSPDSRRVARAGRSGRGSWQSRWRRAQA
jgi:bifunctional non-homologous end joining protein LigD